MSDLPLDDHQWRSSSKEPTWLKCFQQKENAFETLKKCPAQCSAHVYIHTHTGRKSPVTIWSHRIALDSRVGDLDVLGLLE